MKLTRIGPSEGYQRIQRLLGDAISATAHIEEQLVGEE
jgi:hypothetical protein